MIRTRFAPSPTGVLHIGSVRTALFCWLYARHYGGRFVLRIEDTDKERSTKENVDAILEGMDWLGLDWDEGPFYQSERYDRYRQIIDQWLEEGKAYHCYCSKEELDEHREQQMASGGHVRYVGRCRDRREPRPGLGPADGPDPEHIATGFHERAETLLHMAASARYCYEDFDATLWLVGKDRTIRRMDHAIGLIEARQAASA